MRACAWLTGSGVLMRRQSTYASASQTLWITPGDRQALRLLAAGHSNGDVAADLGISTREMETLLTKLFAAMGAATQAEAIAAAQSGGLLASRNPYAKMGILGAQPHRRP